MIQVDKLKVVEGIAPATDASGSTGKYVSDICQWTELPRKNYGHGSQIFLKLSLMRKENNDQNSQ